MKMTNTKEMKIFRRIQQNLAVIGLIPNQPPNERSSLNFRQIAFVVLCVVNVTFLSAYIFTVANGIELYMDAIFSLVTVLTTAVAFVSIIFKNGKCYEIIKHLEQELDLSKQTNKKKDSTSK